MVLLMCTWVIGSFLTIHRFRADDLEVQLSDELAGSLRQLKVLKDLFLFN